MKNVIYVIILCLIFLCSCKEVIKTENNTVDVTELLREEEKQEMGKSLKITKITTKNDDEIFKRQVERYKEKYPDIDIKITEYDDYNKFISAINIQIESGSLDDLVDATYLDYNKLMDNGNIVNYKKLIETDYAFDIGDYYVNVLDAFNYRNAWPVFPISFVYGLIGVNNELPPFVVDQYIRHQTINTDDLWDLYKLIYHDDWYPDIDFTLPNILVRDLGSYIDFNNKTCNISSNINFIRLLEDSKKYFEEELDYFNRLGGSNASIYNDNLLEERALQYAFLKAHCFNTQFIMQNNSISFSNFVPLVNRNGEINIEMFTGFVLNNASENKTLAWNFLKYVTSVENNIDIGEIDIPYMPYVPINKMVFEQLYKSQCIRQINNLKYTENEIVGDVDENINKAIKILKIYNEHPMRYNDYLSVIFTLFETISPYFSGEADAVQVADELQNRIISVLNGWYP